MCVAAGLTTLAYTAVYGGRIYPGVLVNGSDVGGLTVEQAASVLAHRCPDPPAEAITLRAIERSWQLSWSDVGREYDWADTAAAAYQLGRDGPFFMRMLSPWRIRLRGQSLELRVDPADPRQVKATLNRLAPQVHVPPTDAQLLIGPNGVTSIPSMPGQALDVETNAEKVCGALAAGRGEVRLAAIEIPPNIPEPEPAHTLARNLLAEPFTLVANDPLTDYEAEFAAPPERTATWLEAVPHKTADGARLELEVNEPLVQAWLLEIEPQLGSERTLDLAKTLTRIVTALTAGDHHAQCAIRHPESSHVVQPGDTLFDIAYRHGFPQWRLEEANPDVEPDNLAIGMELTVPTIDVLFPEPLVSGKRIEIDLPAQRLRAYEDDELVYDFTCSSGMTSTPTIAGQFQVLFKEPNAYAQRWNLEMPYFLAIYFERPGFANGIHELPIGPDGRRLWAGVLGWPASYGCIILNLGDAQRLYRWAPVGTLVRITGVAPGTPIPGPVAVGDEP
jgi:hypothetical protein